MKISRFILHLVLLLFVVVLVGFVFQRPIYAMGGYQSLGFLVLLWLIPSMTVFGLKESFSYFKEAFIPFEKRISTAGAMTYYKTISLYLFLGSVLVSGATSCYWFVNLTDYNDLGRFLEVILLTPIYAVLAVMGIFLPLMAELSRTE